MINNIIATLTGRHEIYPIDRISALAFINNWYYENEKPTHNSNLNGASFTQDGLDQPEESPVGDVEKKE
jgi:hypothetical protein